MRKREGERRRKRSATRREGTLRSESLPLWQSSGGHSTIREWSNTVVDAGDQYGFKQQWGACWVRIGLNFLILKEATQHDGHTEPKWSENIMYQQSWDHDFSSFSRSQRQGVTADVSVVMNGSVGWKHQQVTFTKIKLEVVVLHLCRCVQETVWDLVWDWKLIQSA